MIVIFTDLDGTLLDRETYRWDAAQPALQRIRELGVPLVFVTSKTRVEVEHLRTRFHNTDPFVVENGGAAVIPGRGVIEWGTRYQELCTALGRIALACGCRLRGFHQMQVADIAALTGLETEEAARAARREYDEPFIVEGPCDETRLHQAVAREGLRHTLGGRFHHLHGANDKAIAVEAIVAHYRSLYGEVTSVGLGDAPNDLGFLEVVDRRWYSQEGPAGWNRFVLSVLHS